MLENMRVDKIHFGLDSRTYKHLVIELTLNGDGYGTIYCSPVFTTKDDSNYYWGYSDAIAKLHELLDFFEVTKIEDIKDKYIRVEFDNNGHINDTIYHIIKNKSFSWK